MFDIGHIAWQNEGFVEGLDEQPDSSCSGVREQGSLVGDIESISLILCLSYPTAFIYFCSLFPASVTCVTLFFNDADSGLCILYLTIFVPLPLWLPSLCHTLCNDVASIVSL